MRKLIAARLRTIASAIDPQPSTGRIIQVFITGQTEPPDPKTLRRALITSARKG